MPYLNTETNSFNISEQEIKLAYPNTSFTDPFVPFDPFVFYFTAPQPEHDQVIQSCREIAPVLTSKGHYEQEWEIVPAFSEYTDGDGVLHTVAEQEAKAIEAERKARVPQSVTPRQFRQALTRLGFRQIVESAVSASDQDTKDWYEFATEFVRTNEHIVAMASALGITEEQVDAVFIEGFKL